MTWFAHDIEDFDAAQRIYDVCLASNPLMPVYLSAAVCIASPYVSLAITLPQMVLQSRDLVLQCECEFSAVYKRLTTLSNDTNIEVFPFCSLNLSFSCAYRT